MRSIHGVGELMTQVVLRGGGFLPMTPLAAAPEGNVKQSEPEKEDILVMDTKLKIIEILQVLRQPLGLSSSIHCVLLPPQVFLTLKLGKYCKGDLVRHRALSLFMTILCIIERIC